MENRNGLVVDARVTQASGTAEPEAALAMLAEVPGSGWAPAWSTQFQLPSAMKFMVLTQIALPVEPRGGRHVYSFRLDGAHERFDIPLDIVVQ